MKPKVLVSHCEAPESGMKLLSEECELVVVPGLNPSYDDILETVRAAGGVEGIFWCIKHPLDAGIIDAAGPKLRAVSTMSAGYDHIDVKLLKERGIPVGSTPNVLNDAVADIAVALVLTASRRLQEGRRVMEQGTWDTISMRWMLGRDLAGSTVGIVGLGGIGQAFAKRIKAFNIGRLVYSGHKPKSEAIELGAEFMSFDALIEVSDFVVLACPLSSETRNLFNDSVFKRMKKTSILVNVSRGGIVDQDALLRALQAGEIWAAGLDVMVPEPLPTDHPLLSQPNCVLFAHQGSGTEGTRSAMSTLAARNVLCGLSRKTMPSPIL